MQERIKEDKAMKKENENLELKESLLENAVGGCPDRERPDYTDPRKDEYHNIILSVCDTGCD